MQQRYSLRVLIGTIILLAGTGIVTPTLGFVSIAASTSSAPLRRSSSSDTKPQLLAEPTDDNSDRMSAQKEFKVKTWNPLRLAVLRLGLTELRYTSPFNYGEKKGTFSCAYCGNPLFDGAAKYDSGSGWPSFWRSENDDSITYKREFDGRLECQCKQCSSHLGHVFLDGPRPSDVEEEALQASPDSDPRSKTNNGRLPRFCVNGACLRLDEESVK